MLRLHSKELTARCGSITKRTFKIQFWIFKRIFHPASFYLINLMHTWKSLQSACSKSFCLSLQGQEIYKSGVMTQYLKSSFSDYEWATLPFSDWLLVCDCHKILLQCIWSYIYSSLGPWGYGRPKRKPWTSGKFLPFKAFTFTAWCNFIFKGYDSCYEHVLIASEKSTDLAL